ncbi:unnamed protein product [Heterosigma akashiwo]
MSLSGAGPFDRNDDTCANRCLWCCGASTMWSDSGLWFVSLVTLVMARQHIAKKYNIQEDESNSILLACCCGPCSMCQIINEVEKRENGELCCCSWTPKI